MRTAFAVAALAALAACRTPAQPPAPPDGTYALAAIGGYTTGSAQLQWFRVQGIDLDMCFDPLRGGIDLQGGSYSLEITYGDACSYGPGSPYREVGSFVARDGALTFRPGGSARPTRILEAHGGQTGDPWRPADTVDLLFTNPATGSSGYLRFDRVRTTTP